MESDEKPQDSWLKRVVINAPNAAWVSHLKSLTVYERSYHFSRMLVHGLQAVNRAGIPSTHKGGRDFVDSFSLNITISDFLELERVRTRHKCSLSSIVVAMYSHTSTLARANLEAEYARRGLPGDPSTLSDRVLSTWLNEDVPSTIRDAFADLTAQTSHLQRKVDAFNWMQSVALSTLLFHANQDTLDRYAKILDLPHGLSKPSDILKRLAKYFS